MIRQLLLLNLLFISFIAHATIPVGYYSSLDGKQTAALKTALHDIICQDTTHYLTYGSGKNHTWQGLYSTDRNPADNLVIDMYSDSLRYFPTDYISLGYPGFGMTIQLEHSVPKSWWGCDITHPDCAAEDLNHLYPSDGKTNNYKSDHPLGIVSGAISYSNSVSKIGAGSNYGYVGTVFEPADQYKGDFARSYFYIATAYEHYVNKWVTTNSENMMEADAYPTLKPWAIQLLLQWSRQDPVSQKELDRVENVFNIQRNRNPFIDYPELIEYIWGDKKDIPWHISTKINENFSNQFKITYNSDISSFRIESEENIPIVLAIYTVEGKKIFQNISSTNTQIKVSDLQNGIYIFEAVAKNFIFRQKQIISTL